MSKTSRRWLREHFSDPYVKKAHQAGLRSRAIYKLIELQERDKLFSSGMHVIDLGAAPGSWTQQLAKWVSPKGHVIAIDILPIQPIQGVECIQGDFNDDIFVDQVLQRCKTEKIDWVVSDMAPNLTGINDVDQARSMHLAEVALDFALRILQKKGGFLIKLFQGEGFDSFLVEVRRHFKKVHIRKPAASRGRSREVYLLARDRMDFI